MAQRTLRPGNLTASRTALSYLWNLRLLREKGGEDAVQLARYLRLARVWALLMFGSALALAAVIIQLVLAYQ